MDRIDKYKAASPQRADAAADIDLINQHSIKPLAPEDVYAFSVILCDNEVDRDIERFPDSTLEKLARLFVGKTGLTDHRWSAERQIARIYRAQVEDTGGKTSLGEALKVVRADAYMLRTEGAKEMITAIEGGIIKEVSVGFAAEKLTCSICGQRLAYDWQTGKDQCENGHVKGETYDGDRCIGEIWNPSDAFEFSFVAVPAQKGAGVTKGAGDLREAFAALLEADLAPYGAEVKKLLPRLRLAVEAEEARAERLKILQENEKYLKGKKENA